MQRSIPFIALLLLSSVCQAQSSWRLSQDNRMVIAVGKVERNLVLTEMREYLHGLHNIQHAMARKDMKGLALLANDMAPKLERLPASLRERFPEEFTQLAIAQKEAFQSLAHIGDNKGEISAALEQTAEIITYCSGCHDTYRFEVMAPKPSSGKGLRHQGGR
jgi:hypothetical protein